MGQYFSKAKRHAGKIEYYYKHAGERGYRQALGHWNDLADLIRRARDSKKDKSDAPLIQAIRESVKNMMDEMKEREANPEST